MTRVNRLTSGELEEIRERADKATEGPWRMNDSELYGDDIVWGPRGPGYGAVCHVEIDYPRRPRIEDADFIANSREDIPKLLAEIDQLRKSVDMSKRIVNVLTHENAVLKGEKPITAHVNGGGDE